MERHSGVGALVVSLGRTHCMVGRVSASCQTICFVVMHHAMLSLPQRYSRPIMWQLALHTAALGLSGDPQPFTSPHHTGAFHLSSGLSCISSKPSPAASNVGPDQQPTCCSADMAGVIGTSTSTRHHSCCARMPCIVCGGGVCLTCV
jgi:hypothetical protein